MFESACIVCVRISCVWAKNNMSFLWTSAKKTERESKEVVDECKTRFFLHLHVRSKKIRSYATITQSNYSELIEKIDIVSMPNYISKRKHETELPSVLSYGVYRRACVHQKCSSQTKSINSHRESKKWTSFVYISSVRTQKNNKK